MNFRAPLGLPQTFSHHCAGGLRNMNDNVQWGAVVNAFADFCRFVLACPFQRDIFTDATLFCIRSIRSRRHTIMYSSGYAYRTLLQPFRLHVLPSLLLSRISPSKFILRLKSFDVSAPLGSPPALSRHFAVVEKYCAKLDGWGAIPATSSTTITQMLMSLDGSFQRDISTDESAFCICTRCGQRRMHPENSLLGIGGYGRWAACQTPPFVLDYIGVGRHTGYRYKLLEFDGLAHTQHLHRCEVILHSLV